MPPPEDEALLERIRLDYQRFSRAFKAIIANDQAGAPASKNQPILARAVNADTDLGATTNELATRTRAQTDALIAENGSAYAGSRDLVVGVGAASVGLALLLGFVLSWSLIGPIQRSDERLAEIASGDFSRHVDVANRDELGALAENLNRMNDELKRLYEELGEWNRTLETRVEELRASRSRVVLAADAERRRIERDLHDGAQQHLIGLAVHLRLARDLADSDPATAKKMLETLGDDLQEALEQMRDLAHGIYPPLLQDRGLAEALAAAARRGAARTTLQTDGLARYAADVEATVYFCCLEALQNVSKYAGPKATARIRVHEDEKALLFEVEDDGEGFDPNGRAVGAGITNMRDRVGAIGGTLSVTSVPGRGTTISGMVPIHA
jgi:signal transduction histidine kinase